MSGARQKEIAKLLKRWSQLRGEQGRIEAERDQEIEPYRARFERQCAPIHARATAQLAPVEQHIADIEAVIVSAMQEGISADGTVAITRVDAAFAIAEVITHEQRELDTKLFFESVPASQRSAAFWTCLKTLIGQAEKFLGQTRLNQICHAKRTHRVQIRSAQ